MLTFRGKGAELVSKHLMIYKPKVGLAWMSGFRRAALCAPSAVRPFLLPSPLALA